MGGVGGERGVEEEVLHVDDDEGGAGRFDQGALPAAEHGDFDGVGDGGDGGPREVVEAGGGDVPVVVDVAEGGDVAGVAQT